MAPASRARFLVLQEADETSIGSRVEAVQNALWARNDNAPEADRWISVEVFLEHVIVRQGRQLLQVPYTFDEEGAVVWGEPQAVEMEYRPIRVEATGSGEVQLREAEAGEERGTEWEIEIIRPGHSKNGFYYPPETLRAAAPLFEGVHVYAFVDDGRGHKKNPLEKSPQHLVGWIEGVSVREPDGVVTGHLRFLKDGVAQQIRAQLVDAWDRGKKDLMGVSMDARGMGRPGVAEGIAAQVVEVIRSVLSVEVVLYPAAGGRFTRLVASATADEEVQPEESQPMKKPALQRLWALLESRRPDALKGLKQDTATLDQLADVATDAEFQEAMTGAATPAPAAAPLQEAAGGAATAVAPSRAEIALSNLELREALGSSRLPDYAQSRIRTRLSGQVLTEQQIQEAIREERDYLAQANPATVRGFGEQREGAGISVGAEKIDRLQAGLDRSFGLVPEDPELRNIKPLGFRGLYNEITLGNDPDVRGQLQESAVGQMLQESFTSATLPRVVANTLHRRMAKDYAEVDYAERRIISLIGSAADFKNQESVRVGYFGDISTVDPEAADYAELAAYGEEAATYAVTQRGNLVTITRKHILNDDVGHVAKVASRLGRAARRTFARFVWNFFKNNGNIYDGTAWFTVGHANLLTTALSATSLDAAEQALFNQTEPGSAEKLGLTPYLLAVPIQLKPTAMALNNSELIPGSANNDANPWHKRFGERGENIIVNPFMTDANDWGVFANPADVDTIEVKFLNGQEEPELFLADAPTVGQMFVADKIQYKIRHEYGGAVTDFRGAVKSVVA